MKRPVSASPAPVPRRGLFVTAAAAAVFTVACADSGGSASDGAGAATIQSASVRFHDADERSIGEARLTEGPNGVLIDLELDGLPPGFKAIHIHDTGTCDDHHDGFQASGGHLNPDGRQHGLMNPEGPDAGDFPNIYVHDDGRVYAQLFTPYASLGGAGGRAWILDESGAALVIHENPDDHYTQPIGGAGARIACGVVEAD